MKISIVFAFLVLVAAPQAYSQSQLGPPPPCGSHAFTLPYLGRWYCIPTGNGGGATVPNTTNFLVGGAANAAGDSGVAPTAIPYLNPGGGSNTYTAGINNIFQASVTTQGLTLPSHANPSGPTSGAINNASGLLQLWDGAAWRVICASPAMSATCNVTTLNDALGGTFLKSSATASAIDGLQITTAATANPANITLTPFSSGSDAIIDITLAPLGANRFISFGPSAFLKVQSEAGLARLLIDDTSNSYIENAGEWVRIQGSSGGASAQGITLGSTTCVALANGTTVNNTIDTVFGRANAAGVLGVWGNSGCASSGAITGTIDAASFLHGGAAPTAAGTGGFSTIAAPTGGASAGEFIATSTASGTVTLTFAKSAPTHYVCDAHDVTTAANRNVLNQSGGAANTAIFTTDANSVTSGDVFRYKCDLY